MTPKNTWVKQRGELICFVFLFLFVCFLFVCFFVCFLFDCLFVCLYCKLLTHTSSFLSAAAKKRQPLLEKFWSNARVELAPPRMSDWPAIKSAFVNIRRSTMSGRFLDTSVKDSIANTLVAVEIAMWFYVGEIIGRRSIVGYNV